MGGLASFLLINKKKLNSRKINKQLIIEAVVPNCKVNNF
jgi:hypothetical protein